MSYLNGIDVSSWQPGAICAMVDYDFAIVKATEGLGYVSPSCNQQAGDVIARDLGLGLYHFARNNPAAQEATYFLDHIAGYIGRAMLVLDYEDSALANGREWVRTWIRKVKRLTGIIPAVYCSGSPAVAQDLPGLCAEENALLWIANYPLGYQEMEYRQDLEPYCACGMHQYTSSGRLSGYGGNLDLNVFFGDANAFKAYYGEGAISPAPQPPSAPEPSPPPSGGITYIIKSGDTLSGIGAVYGVSWQELARVNSLTNPSLIFPGQSIWIPQASGGGATAGNGETYVVKQGDTLSGIAAKYGTTWQELQRINGIPNANLIYPGQVIRLV